MSIIPLKKCAADGCPHKFPEFYFSDYCGDHDQCFGLAPASASTPGGSKSAAGLPAIDSETRQRLQRWASGTCSSGDQEIDRWMRIQSGRYLRNETLTALTRDGQHLALTLEWSARHVHVFALNTVIITADRTLVDALMKLKREYSNLRAE